MTPNGLLSFVVGLLVGGVALAVGARVVVYRDHYGSPDLRREGVTAILSALVWALFGWIPVVGTLLASVGWLALLNYRYPGGWARAAILGIAAWAVAVVILAALALLGLGGVSAVGIPGA